MNFLRFLGKNIVNVKFFLASIIIIVYSWLYAQDYVSMALMTNNGLNVIEPAIYLLMNNSVPAFIFTLCFIFSFSDAPFEDGILPYYVYRVGYKRWCFRLLLFFAIVSFLLVIIPIAVSVIACLKEGFFSFDVWSKTARFSSNANQLNLSFAPEFSMDIFENSPIEALIKAILISFLHCNAIAQIILFLNSIAKKLWGVFSVITIESVGYIFSFTVPSLARHFPFMKASWASLGNTSYFLIIALLFGILNFFVIKKYKFESGEAK